MAATRARAWAQASATRPPIAPSSVAATATRTASLRRSVLMEDLPTVPKGVPEGSPVPGRPREVRPGRGPPPAGSVLVPHGALDPHVLREEGEVHGARRPVALLADDALGLPRHLRLPVGVRLVVLGAVEE